MQSCIKKQRRNEIEEDYGGSRFKWIVHSNGTKGNMLGGTRHSLSLNLFRIHAYESQCDCYRSAQHFNVLLCAPIPVWCNVRVDFFVLL